MDKYFNSYREMISLRGLTDHTLNGYSTYIRSYLVYCKIKMQKVAKQKCRLLQLHFVGNCKILESQERVAPDGGSQVGYNLKNPLQTYLKTINLVFVVANK